MAQNKKIGSHKTDLFSDKNGLMHVKYHKTNVVSFNDQYIILNNDGFLTKTTKLRMNQASNQFNLGFSVYQNDFQWYVKFGQFTYNFKNNVCILDRSKLNDYAQLDSIEIQ